MTEIVEDDDTTIDTLQKSVFHIREDKMKALNKRSSLHRVVVVSRINPLLLDSKQKIIALFQVFLHEFAEAEPLTGLMLIYPLHVMIVLETSTENLERIFSVLAQHHKTFAKSEEVESTEWILSHSKILNISYDIHMRLYQLFSSRILDMGPANLELYEPGESDDKIVIDLLTMVTKLGVFLSKEPNKAKLEEVLDNVRDLVPHLIPQQVVIGYLSSVSEHSCLVTPGEYLAQFSKPYERNLESEYVWPLTEKMFPYH